MYIKAMGEGSFYLLVHAYEQERKHGLCRQEISSDPAEEQVSKCYVKISALTYSNCTFQTLIVFSLPTVPSLQPA